MKRIFKRILDMKVTTAAWIVIGSLWIGLGLIHYLIPNTAHAGVGGHAHSKAHVFEWDYNAEHDVYCGWRHGFEGMSCVNINE